MTPLLLALGIYCHLAIVILLATPSIQKPMDVDRANFLDGTFLLHLGGMIFFWVKASDILFGWSA